ncbi:MAG: YggT family protein [Kordiimonadaceae bacterium]|nr:YggT family protein [Kordiimonadaceae bacterium]MBO6568556.1 YggT family protein [Kordiimonadaceae bacterium]MBO6963715.1 YggT family protein [Kordiimonadaceae bacterium]
MTALFWLIDAVLGFYYFLLIVTIIMSWLVMFGVINSYQPFVQSVQRFLYAITEPALVPIRRTLGRFFPNLGGLDISPIILIFLIFALRVLLRSDIAPLFGIYNY